MNKFEWAINRSNILSTIKIKVIEGLSIEKACREAGISYYNEYQRFLTKIERDEIIALGKRKLTKVETVVAVEVVDQVIDSKTNNRTYKKTDWWEKNKVELIEAIKKYIEEGCTVQEAYAKAGVSYFGSSKRRHEISATLGIGRGKSKSRLGNSVVVHNKYIPSAFKIQKIEELVKIPMSISLPVFSKSSNHKVDFRANLNSILQYLGNDEDYCQVLDTRLNELEQRGFINAKQKEVLNACFQGISLTLKRFPTEVIIIVR